MQAYPTGAANARLRFFDGCLLLLSRFLIASYLHVSEQTLRGV